MVSICSLAVGSDLQTSELSCYETDGFATFRMKDGPRNSNDNSRKSVRWSAVPVPCLSRLCLKVRGEQGSGPKGVDDLCFHTNGEFSPPPPGIGPLGWDLGL